MVLQGHQAVKHKHLGLISNVSGFLSYLLSERRMLTELSCTLEMKMWPCEVPQADQLGCSFTYALIEARVSKCQKEQVSLCSVFCVCFQCAEIGDFGKEEH